MKYRPRKTLSLFKAVLTFAFIISSTQAWSAMTTRTKDYNFRARGKFLYNVGLKGNANAGQLKTVLEAAPSTTPAPTPAPETPAPAPAPKAPAAPKKMTIMSVAIPALKGLKARVDDQKGLMIETPKGRTFTGLQLGISKPGDKAEDAIKRSVALMQSLADQFNAKIGEASAAKVFITLEVTAEANQADVEPAGSVRVAQLPEMVGSVVNQIWAQAVQAGKVKPSKENFLAFTLQVAPQIFNEVKKDHAEMIEKDGYDADTVIDRMEKEHPAPKPAPQLNEKGKYNADAI